MNKDISQTRKRERARGTLLDFGGGGGGGSSRKSRNINIWISNYLTTGLFSFSKMNINIEPF